MYNILYINFKKNDIINIGESMKNKDKNKEIQNKKIFNIVKIILLLVAISIMIFATIKLFPYFKNLGTTQGRLEFKEKIDTIGFKGILLVITLVIIQLFLAFIPGEPIEIIAGMCCGTIGGMIAIFVGVFLASSIIFFSVRKFGKNFIHSFLKEENIDKLEKNKLFSDEKKLEFVLFILFFIPGTPKDLFVYLGAILPINPTRFLFISTFARFPSVITSTYCGANLIDGNFKMSITVFAITFLISILGIFAYNKFQKNN